MRLRSENRALGPRCTRVRTARTGETKAVDAVCFSVCARSSTDRASDYGSEGWGFESLRARPGQRPVPITGPAFACRVQQRKYSSKATESLCGPGRCLTPGCRFLGDTAVDHGEPLASLAALPFAGIRACHPGGWEPRSSALAGVAAATGWEVTGPTVTG
jgi:hypothetical protein